MKKFLLLLTLLLLFALPALAEEDLSVGSTFLFGAFEQNANTADGAEPIEWIVLKNDGKRALLISKQVLTCQPFHTAKENVSYKDSSLRAYLNGEFFLTAFSAAERSAVMTAINSNAAEQGNLAWNAQQWDDTDDQLFLLSFKDTAEFFSDKTQRQTAPTEYAKRQGTITLVLPHMDYWLRSAGNADATACIVNIHGEYASATVTDKKGIRPALWLDLNASQDNFPSAIYANACALRDEGHFAAAIPVFDSLGNYSDSAAQAKACRDADTTALHVGFYYTFGQYEQDNNTANGNEPIEWLILANDGETALLMSRHVLDCQPYASSAEGAAWGNSVLREWLNGTFMQNAFTEAEQSALLSDASEDLISLLSADDAEALLTKEARKATLSEYARAQGAALPLVPNADFYLRDSVKDSANACIINMYGDSTTVRATDKKGVRPVIRLNLSADEGTFAAAQYTAAVFTQESGAYLDAAAIFDSIGNYLDSTVRAQQCRYAQAEIEEANGNLDEAIKLFSKLGTYSDSYDRLGECRYAKALSVMNSGDYKKAMKLFGELGNYKDSITRMTECMDQQGILRRYMTVTTVNTGTDNGYSKSTTIGGKDPHFGWNLGRFFMTNFTRVSGDSANPVFLKTLGDKVTMWYELEQDITKLDGKTTLSITADTNGYDEYFGVKKTDFGRGTLIVRQTNYRNEQTDPVIYTDYLAATTSHGAVTKVEFLEEGDYEVALNYETTTSGLIPVYNNYRVFFRFSVRNGNCMVYPFDIATGAELGNSSIAPNGFYLDLARSRYLDINVRRKVLAEGAVGLTADERFNRPAKDGDRYTQEGVYIIDVSNRYTGESTAKTIFVGSDELLQKYIAGGFVLP